jgi:aerobic-type carbon monoxide dehydrogenase small subunit (CoxS/CutS family)
MATLSQTRLTVNRKLVEISCELDRPLLEVLREDLQLTGTKYGCGEGACAACTVLVDSHPVKSCQTLLSEVVGKSIVTIEGIAEGEKLHPVQVAFMEENAFQCGYCTAGMIIGTIALLRSKPEPSETEIKQGLNGHICRCCAHPRIVNAVKHAAEIAKG